MASLPLWYWCCCFRLNTKEVFFFQHLNFLFSKPVFVISYPFLLFSRLASFWAITITSVLNSLSTSLTYCLGSWQQHICYDLMLIPLYCKKKNLKKKNPNTFFDRIYPVLEFLKVKYHINNNCHLKYL